MTNITTNHAITYTNTWVAGKTLEKYAKSQALQVCSVSQMDMPSDRVNGFMWALHVGLK